MALTLASCSGAGRAAIPEGSVISIAALESVAIRETAVAFLEAYAGSGPEAGPLAALVAGREMEDWVHWLEVRNVGVGGRLGGEADIRAVRVLRLREDLAAAAVDASVHFTFREGDGPPTPLTPRRFHGPMILVPTTGPGGWGVFDVVRDGRAMRDSIVLLDPPATARGQGLRVEVVSVHRFTSGTSVNLRIRNRRDEIAEVDVPHTVLQVNGRFLGARAASVGLLAPLPAGSEREGVLEFPTVELTWVPEILLVRVAGIDEPVQVPLPPQAFLSGA